MRKVLLMLSFVLVIGAIVNILYYLPTTPNWQQFEDTAKQYDVRIIRDDYGVPHIYGKTDKDSAFGLAYAHAEDDYKTIEDVILATRGTLATVKGIDAAKTDYLIQFMQVWEAVNAGYETKISQHTTTNSNCSGLTTALLIFRQPWGAANSDA